MSHSATHIVLMAPIKPPALKLTAAVMAAALNHKTQLLNPSIATIAEAVGIERRQAQRYVKTLISMGLLSVIENARGGAPGTTPNYVLHIDRIAAMCTEAHRADAATGVVGDIPTGDAEDTPTDVIGDTPAGIGTGVADDADGCHPRPRRVSPMTRTGVTDDTQTRKGTGKGTWKEQGKATRTPSDPCELLPDVDKQLVLDWMAVRKAKRAGSVQTARGTGSTPSSLTLSHARATCSTRCWCKEPWPAPMTRALPAWPRKTSSSGRKRSKCRLIPRCPTGPHSKRTTSPGWRRPTSARWRFFSDAACCQTAPVEARATDAVKPGCAAASGQSSG